MCLQEPDPRPSLAPISTGDVAEKPSLLACIECRRKHVKCDAGVPQCLRCQTQGLRCRYEPSRRGLKRRRHHNQSLRSPLRQGGLSSTLATADTTSKAQRREPDQIVWDSADPFAGFQQQLDEEDAHLNPLSLDGCLIASNHPQADIEADTLEDDILLVNLFYANFFPAHPFLVPQALYAAQNYPSYLKLVVHLIGCHYSGTQCSETMQGLADEALKKAWASSKRSYMLIQALLLFSIVLHARRIPDRCRSSLAEAVSLALEINMYRKSTIVEYSRGSSILEESIRRTWWELYMTEGFMASLDRGSSFRCNGVRADVPLPCDEYLYTEDTLILEPPTREQFEARIYSKEDYHFSSFSYRIEAAQLLARALAIGSMQTLHRDQIQNIDNLLAAWPHHLDTSKAELVDSAGAVDRMLLQAHMMIQYITMCLHLPRSDLTGLGSVLPGFESGTGLLPTYSRSMHGIKAVEAAKRFADLAALETSILKHPPFMLDGLLLSCTIQLSACSSRPSNFHGA